MKDINENNFTNFTKKELFRQLKEVSNLQMENSEGLVKAKNPVKIGYFELHISSNKMKWSKGVEDVLFWGATKDPSLEAIIACIHPEKAKMVRQNFQMVVDHGKPFDMDCRIVKQGCEDRWIQQRAELVLDIEGKPLSVLGTVMDITERKEVEIALVKSERILSLTYDTAGDILFQISVESDGYRFLTVNETFLSATGVPREAIEGKFITEVIPEESIELVKRNYKKAIETKKPVRWEEVSQYPTGEKTGVVTIAPFYDDSGECRYLIGSVHDITERNKVKKELLDYKTNLEQLVESRTKALKESKEFAEGTLKNLKETQSQLIQSEKMASLGLLTAGIGHELNNPINFITTGVVALEQDFSEYAAVMELYESYGGASVKIKSEMLKKVSELKVKYNFTLLKSNIDQQIADVKNGAIRSADILRGLSSFSRSNTTEKLMFDLHDSLDSSLKMLKNKVNNRIKIIKRYDGQLPCVLGHLEQVSQVFTNILSNAIDACVESGTITVTTSSNNKKIEVSIKDNGEGISNEIQGKIFDPFFTTKKVGEGTGLGLSISFGIIEKHNGGIKVKSKVNEGSEFIVSLPIEYVN